MRSVFAITVTLCAVSLLTACAAGKVTDWRNSEVVVKPWETEAESSTYAPLDLQMRSLAPDAQLACLRRSWDIRRTQLTSSSLGGVPAKKAYILSDLPLVFPEDMSNYVLVHDTRELERLARASRQDVFFFSMRTRGQAEVQGHKGVVISCSSEVIDWQRAEWDALTPAEKEGKATPEFRVFLYGAWLDVFVTRNGSNWLVFEGLKTVS